MKISTRGRYGIRLLIDLAEHLDESHVSLASVAERQGISLRYLEQLAVILKRAGYIRSVKGASGGYVLTRPPEEILLGDVLRVLEGDMLVADPEGPGKDENKFQRCIRLLVLDKLNTKIARIIDNKTLASIAGAGHETYMYYI
ncbi:MAG: Rrf2 family transcriptional regulator [Spirochaetaceae bacterium]|jgi:Rrf2 family protein|nr:Rrf2 family transcriptional regulator [Spirochaetaceae bacterium]